MKVVDPAVSVSVMFPSTSNDTLFCPDASSGYAASVSARACASGVIPPEYVHLVQQRNVPRCLVLFARLL